MAYQSYNSKIMRCPIKLGMTANDYPLFTQYK